MKNFRDDAREVFPCTVLGCQSGLFSTRANLKRHTAAKHTPPVKMACDKMLHRHSSNIKRHEKTCSICSKKSSSPRWGSAEPRTQHSEWLSEGFARVPVTSNQIQDKNWGYFPPTSVCIPALGDVSHGVYSPNGLPVPSLDSMKVIDHAGFGNV